MGEGEYDEVAEVLKAGVDATVADLEAATTMQQVQDIVAKHYVELAVRVVMNAEARAWPVVTRHYMKAMADAQLGYTAETLLERLGQRAYEACKALYVATPVGETRAAAFQRVARMWRPPGRAAGHLSVKTIEKYVDEAVSTLGLTGGRAELANVFRNAHECGEDR